MNKYKTRLKYVWIFLLVSVLIFNLISSESFTVVKFRHLLSENDFLIFTTYVVLVCIRAVFFIPSTAILLLGIALYRDSPIFLLGINMLGIIIGSTLLFLAGKNFTAEDFFDNSRLKSLHKIKEKITQHGFSVVLAWSFFPFVPTDLMCYVAGSVNMNYCKFILAMFLGEIVLVSIYIWTGKGILELIF